MTAGGLDRVPGDAAPEPGRAGSGVNLLRFVLLGLAAFVLGTLVWRLGAPALRGTEHPPAVAAAPPARTAPPVATQPVPASPPAAPSEPAPASAPSPAAAAPATVPPAAAPGVAMTAQEAHDRILAILDGAPDLARVVEVARAQFPASTERSLAEATEAFRATGRAPTADDVFADVIRDLRLSAGVLAGKAGSDALAALFDSKAAVLAALEQADPRICADYLFGGTSPEFGDFEATHRGLVARNALASVNAMVDGRARGIGRDAPTGADFDAIEAALARKGLSKAETEALLDGRAPDDPPSDQRLCDNARAYLDVLKALPAEARDRVYGLSAELLARS